MEIFQKIGDYVKRILPGQKETDYEDGYYDQYEEDGYSDVEQFSAEADTDHSSVEYQTGKAQEGRRRHSGSRVVNMNTGNTYDSTHAIVVYYPKTINDCPNICEDICNDKAVIVNCESADAEQAQRIADYLGGVIHTVQGTIKRVSNAAIIYSPRKFDVSVDGEFKTRESKPLRGMYR